MGNNKIENTKKQVKREKTAATPNKGKKQTTGTAGNYEAWQPLTPQKPVGYPEEMLEKLSSLDAKMSGLETLPKQMCDLASTLNTVSSDVELLPGLWSRKSLHPTPTPTPGNFDHPTPTPNPTSTPDRLRPSAVLVT